VPSITQTGRDTRELVLVPNNVSLELTWAEFADARPGQSAFRAPPVEVLSLWAGKLLETSQLLEGREVHPVPERFRLLALWERMIAEADTGAGRLARSASDLAAVAREAMDADRLLTHWSRNPRGALDGSGLDLGESFGSWRTGVRRALQLHGWITPHEQLLRLVERLEQGGSFPAHLPTRIEVRGFPEVTRLESRFLAALEGHGVNVVNDRPARRAPEGSGPAVTLERYATPEDEGRGAAAWAKAQLSAGKKRIAVAVNGLAARSAALDRIFMQTFHPAEALAGIPPEFSCYHVTAGPPALEHPLARSALILLELSVAGPKAPQPFDTVSRWLLSPAWAAADDEQAARARLELVLRDAQRATVNLAEVGERGRARACEELVARIARLPQAAEIPVQGSARRFFAWLEHWGWPGPEAHGPLAQQVVDSLRGALEALEFGRVDDDRRALALLRRQLLDRRLRSVGGALSPVQVLDVADLPGQRFDAVRVIDVHADNWPPPARLNRLLPVAVARELPRSSARSQREFTQALQQDVLGCSEQVSFTWPLLAEGVPTSPSPVLVDMLTARGQGASWGVEGSEEALRVPGGLLARAAWPEAGSVIAKERDRVEALARESAPPVDGSVGRLPRAVQVLNHQSACPWAAFLVHRLGVSFTPPPSAFPGAAELGSGVHDALEALYRPYLGTGDQPRAEDVPAAVEQALRRRTRAGLAFSTGSALEAVERRRLESLLCEWLEFEARLPWPNPRSLEERRTAWLAGFELAVRMDRLDGIAQGALILDYKTGAPSTPAWGHERPTELQLPLYAVLMAEAGDAPAGIGLLTVRTHGMKQTLWSGDGSLKAGGNRAGVTLMGETRAAFAEWDEALGHWRQAVIRLLDEFRRGEAAHLVHHPDALAFLGLELLLRTGDPTTDEEEPDDR
jgi:probable DNA repair protein